MAKRKLFHFNHLDQLRFKTDISDQDHTNTDEVFIQQQLVDYRNKWKAYKKKSSKLGENFLQDRTLMMVEKCALARKRLLCTQIGEVPVWAETSRDSMVLTPQEEPRTDRIQSQQV